MPRKSPARMFAWACIAAVFAPLGIRAQGLPAPFPMNEALPALMVNVVQYKPPLKTAPQQMPLRSLFSLPTLLIYVIPGNSYAEQAAVDTIAKVRTMKRLGVAVVLRGMNDREVAAGIDWVSQQQISVPAVIDSSLQLALGLKALRVPSFAVVDAGGVLKMRALHGLDALTTDGKRLDGVLADVAAGKPLGLSDGERVENTTTLLGAEIPTSSLKPAEIGGAKSAVTLSPALKKPALIVFWMATCPHCQREMPRLTAWWRQHKSGIDLVTVTRTDSDSLRDTTQKYLTEKGLLDVPVYAAEPAIYTAYKVEGIPTWVVVAPGGKIVAVHVGEDEDLFADLDAGLQKTIKH